MITATGHYSLIQYCPDPSRLEAANVGVLLFSPEHHFLKALTARDNRRIRHFFGRNGHDWARINSFKQAVEERLEAEQPVLRTVEDLEQFIAKRANRLRITQPRPMRVTEPERDLQQLFAELVGGTAQEGSRHGIRRFLRKRFCEAGLEKKIRTDLRVRVPSFERDVPIPFGYQNGRFNLIQPVRFQAPEPAYALNTACRYAVEGRSLYQHPDPKLGDLQLVVVGAFPSTQQESEAVVRKVLADNDVRLFPLSELDQLIAEIKETAEEVGSARRNGS